MTTTGISDIVRSVLRFQECVEEHVETWMACDEESCAFQMLNDEEIGTSVIRDSYEVVRTAIRVLFYSTTAAEENQGPCSEKLRYFAPILLFLQARFPHEEQQADVPLYGICHPSLQWLLRTVSAYSEPAGATFLAVGVPILQSASV
ncbi:hypothetical protein TNCV_1494991 [Trichonephila clavipes]|nr:hypothetical protein TNCV_1494991 [Trichonephila clavipes]